jgi:hypothetical protein
MQIVTYVCDRPSCPERSEDRTKIRPGHMDIDGLPIDSELCESDWNALKSLVTEFFRPAEVNGSEMPVNDVEHVGGEKIPYDRAECIAWCRANGYTVGPNNYIPAGARAEYIRANPHIAPPDNNKW